MAIEVVGFEMVQGPTEISNGGENSVLHMKESGGLDKPLGLNEPIKFGTHGVEPAKDGDGVSVSDIPKDAVDEWPVPKQIHTLYLVRYRSYDDPTIKAKIDQADKEIQKRNQTRFQLSEALKAKRSKRAELISQIKAQKDDNRQIRTIVDEKIKEIEPLQQALGKLRNANNAARGGGLCSSVEELDSLIWSLEYRIQHESIPLAEEKQILREIKQLEGTRERVIANAAMRAKLQDSLVEKEALQDQVKIIGGDLDGVRKEQNAVRARIKDLDDALKAIDKDIKSLQDELTSVTEKRNKSFENIQQLRNKRDELNAYFYQSRAVLNKARELAATKDIKGVEELSNAEVEKFMSLWNSDKAFRADYEKRILTSLDSRQLSRDGRIRNPDEKPLVTLEEPTSFETEVMSKANSKKTTEDLKLLQVDAAPAKKVQKEANNKVTELNSTSKHSDKADVEIPGLETLQKGTLAKDIKVDSAKKKEMKREEEMAKEKQALQRKKKLAEKSAAKAALRAQKEAEKKLKEIIEREKRARKKAAASAPVINVEPADVTDEAAEPETNNENVEAPITANDKVQKENVIRRRSQPRGPPDALRKVVLKRKKTSNYWVWAAPAALLVLVFIVFVFIHLRQKGEN